MNTRIASCVASAVLLFGCGSTNDTKSSGLGVTAPPTAQPTAGAAGAASVTPTSSASSNTPASSAQPAGMQPAAMQPSTTTTTPSAMTQPAMQPGMMTTTTPSTMTQPPATTSTTPKLAMDECGLHTNWPGDEYCINPPPPDKGFQMHIGPSDYNNPDPKYVMEPGTEVTEDWPATSGNTTDVYYYWRQYRMRPGSHHLIITASGAGSGLGIGLGQRIGGSSNLAKDNPEGGVIAPENQGVGMPLAANSQISNSLHYFNYTDKPIIKEVWVNFWYRDKSLVTTPTNEVFSMLQMGIAPGDHVLTHGSCSIDQPGRLLTVYGHVHSHNKRFSVWRTRGSDKTLIHESYDWTTPNVSEFSSTVTNPMLNPTGHTDGGFSGIMDLQAGDTVEFECDILNDTQNTFVGLNEAMNDEMCIMIGDSVGTSVSPLCTQTNIPAN